ncbi:MAG: histidine phosphatase family protein [Dehalococcoidia bacterium]|nr:histidine phosphatase family protein [Dehalococcoidia bacterium]
MTTIIFETHSTTTDNEQSIATGWLDGALSEVGREQALALGARHRGHIERVIASDLGRARQTVAIAFDGAGVPVTFDARLREWNYGDLNGRPAAEVHGRRLEHLTTPYPGGESLEDVVTRMRAFLRELAPSTGERVLLVGHSATRYALEHLLEGRPLLEVVAAPAPWQPGWTYRLEPPAG